MASEVALLRRQMEEVLQAMQAGLSGLAAGTSKHQFIEMKMKRLGEIEDTLAQQVGPTQARHITVQVYQATIGD